MNVMHISGLDGLDIVPLLNTIFELDIYVVLCISVHNIDYKQEGSPSLSSSQSLDIV